MILQRYILRELVLHFCFAFATVMGVSLLGTTFQVFRAFEGLGLVLLLKIAPLAGGYMAPWALLVASATAGTLVYGRLSAENEVTAMKACGIGAFRILAPALLFGLALAVGAWGLLESVTPWARHTRRVSIRESVFEVLRLPPPGIQRFTVGNYKLSYIDFKEGRLEKPSLFRFDTQGRMLMEYHAPLGQILAEGTSIKIVMSRPRYIQHDPDSRQEHRVQAGGEIEIPLELDDVRDPERRLEDWPRDRLEELMRTTHDKKKKSYIRLILHTRWAGAAAPLLLMLVCAPLGIWVRKGSRLAGLGAALPPLLAYFIVFFVTQGLGEKGRMPPVPAAWLPDLVLALPALWLLWGSRR